MPKNERKYFFGGGGKIPECHSPTKIKALQLHTYEFAFGITILKLLLTFSKDPARTRSFRNARHLLIEESEKKDRVKERKRRCSRERDAEVRVPGTPAY